MVYCGRCGTKAQEGQKFCTVCGAALPEFSGPQASPAGPAASRPQEASAYGSCCAGSAKGRVARHLHVLGILWVAFSVLRLLPGVGLLTFSGFGVRFLPFHFRPFVGPFLGMIGILVIATAIVGILTGWALLERAPWARALALVISVIALLSVPFGTALGIYTLWVLLPAESSEEFRRLSLSAP